ncbi:MAG TPA: YfiR family protein [Candidatus Krumholzibacteria bacterium]|nr:YfiR family protein [Candidatus Krumholzibacteria bacterium]HPD73203.1 YfiR family protein [Candidatus Krumholzibacteria bacterium]HRY40165.1 YfiR family protein [Candidatus Krumholzibacteria bacterium]
MNVAKTSSISTRGAGRSWLMRPGLRRLVAAGMLLGLLSAAARPQDIPEASQLPIFFKLLTYDRTLWEQPRSILRIGLLHRPGDAASQANLVAMVEALTAAADKTINGARFVTTTLAWSPPDELAPLLAGAQIDVLYVTAGNGEYLEAIQKETRGRDILTLAAIAEDVSAGLAVGLGILNGRPVVRVNLGALEAEGQQLDARVLKISEVVDR